MLRIINSVVLWGVLAIVLSSSLTAQKTPETAPLPSQILAAKKVFISNIPGDDLYGSGSTRLYNSFYAAVHNWGRYEIVLTPSDADLIFEINFLNPIDNVIVTGSSVSGATGGSSSDPHLQLVIRDTKTHASLWWFAAQVEPFLLRKTGEKNFDHAVSDLATQLKELASKSASAADGGKPATTQ